ncbi:MAG: UDP-2,4-diacetamido-2,4,6-trideoxy-beta-L-altropyranose hydrolase [Flexistipes sinusarabici]|uniref:UDP-2,4-diacetamido-2,4, 6-trideoxy-beta-L-altropyranose hydrolase n=1 Tax=Flexistipes sinusarabici TaxID=2352 RepID=A0A5D0MNH2_FLESI|nr:UDP-2,4-diacetamido-2,4,6-trideoxy-beta-L-altropyranose hydrolase [Flexistipes sinusarabici]TYB33021.1 MAG: UDP-2,4-diacetamido-2,4,6-trideoxy-beta-L-altropyranose hydrolase [Flexistipes sinusarabici]
MKVAIITEGFQRTGYGHLTRCLSIYQAFEEKNITPLYIANCDEEGKNFIPNTNLLQLNWLENVDEFLSKIKGYDIAVIDSYLAPLEIYEKIYRTVKKAVYIDDYLRLNYPPGVIVNGTVGAESLPYKKDDEHDYLLGIKYIPLRKEFWDVPKIQIKRDARSVLITFGGVDMRNITPKVLKLINDNFPYLVKNVVIGKGFENTDEIKSVADKNTHCFYFPDGEQMKRLMLESDFAISAGGQTLNELATLGLPTIMVQIADNQINNIKYYKNNKLALFAGKHDDSDLFDNLKNEINMVLRYSLRKKLRQNNKIFNGLGAKNITDILVKKKYNNL